MRGSFEYSVSKLFYKSFEWLHLSKFIIVMVELVLLQSNEAVKIKFSVRFFTFLIYSRHFSIFEINPVSSDPQRDMRPSDLQNRKLCYKSYFVNFSCRIYKLHAQPSGGHFQPRPLQREPGHGPAAVQLFHCFLTQHLPDGWPADVTV